MRYGFHPNAPFSRFWCVTLSLTHPTYIFNNQTGFLYKLLSILNDNYWQLNIYTTLIFEYEEILKQEKDLLSLNDEDIDNLIEGICSIANKRSIFYLWRPAARDPDDDFIIDLAVESEADFIITYNQKDLKPAEKFGIRVVSPKEFLQIVGEIS